MSFLEKQRAAAEMRKRTVALKYEGGHPKLPKPRDVAVGKTDTHLVVYDPRRWEPLVEIPKDSIVGVGMDKDVVRYRSAGRAVAGAVIAGALTLGVGTLAGALIGGRRRKKDESTIDMVIEVGKAEVTVSFSGKDIRQRYAEFAALLE
ncbi:MAG: hypothetical protein Q8P31_12560 [Bacillota bacterium]|nr:hypothetical protein [Bacillota bacterium]